MDESTRAKIQKLRELVWGKDIPHSTVPEYREWHEACQEILSFIDRELLSGEDAQIFMHTDKSDLMKTECKMVLAKAKEVLGDGEVR